MAIIDFSVGKTRSMIKLTTGMILFLIGLVALIISAPRIHLAQDGESVSGADAAHADAPYAQSTYYGQADYYAQSDYGCGSCGGDGDGDGDGGSSC